MLIIHNNNTIINFEKISVIKKGRVKNKEIYVLYFKFCDSTSESLYWKKKEDRDNALSLILSFAMVEKKICII